MSVTFAEPVRYMVVKRWWGGYAIWDTKAHDGWWTVSLHFTAVGAHAKARRMNLAEGYKYGF